MLAIGAVAKLLEEYEETKELSPTEFLEAKDKEKKIPVEVAGDFLTVTRHYAFLAKIVEHFVERYKMRIFKKFQLIVLMYTMVFYFGEENWELLCKHKNEVLCKIAEYLMVEENLVFLADAACKVFSHDYVVTKLLRPLLAKMYLVKKLHEQLASDSNEAKPPVLPKGPTMLERVTCNPPPPANTPEEPSHFKSTEVPYKHYQDNEIIRTRLSKEHKRNREHARALLERARLEAFSCYEIKKSKVVKDEGFPTPPFKHKRPPPKSCVSIKTNAATIIREAALLAKREEREIQKMESLMQGGRDDYKISALEADMRNALEQERSKEIERRHLLGQLTYEEAILAKRKLSRENKEKAAQFKEERNKLLDEIERWRVEEQKKIKALIRACQESDRAARQAQERLLEKRQRGAKLFKDENRKLLTQSLRDKQEELQQKVKLIQELRMLQQVRCLHVAPKEFDPTETGNLGLLCEMSVAELQERLGLLRIEMQRVLEERRKKIADSKERKAKLLEDAKEFIVAVKSQPKLPSPAADVQNQHIDAPDVIELREKLQRARRMRLATA